jgi:hypothetical protein
MRASQFITEFSTRHAQNLSATPTFATDERAANFGST